MSRRRVKKTRKKKRTYFKKYDLYSDANPKIQLEFVTKQKKTLEILLKN